MKLRETASLARYSIAMRAVMSAATFGAVTADDGTAPADVALDTVTETATFTFVQPPAVRPRAASDRCPDQGAQRIEPLA